MAHQINVAVVTPAIFLSAKVHKAAPFAVLDSYSPMVWSVAFGALAASRALSVVFLGGIACLP
jgi:hypothetical protein